MPGRVPILGTARLAAHHVETPSAVGSGEWFDVLALGPTRVALAAGTVGRQPSAAAEAAAASTLRAVLTECLLAGGTVPEALRRLDEAAARSTALHGATAALAVLDTETGEVCHARCGHLPALQLGPGTPGWPQGPIDDEAGGPLGLGAKPPTLRTDRLPPGGLLLLHAGGADTRSTPVDGWLRSLVEAATELWPPGEVADSPSAPDVFCARLVDRLGGRSALPGLTLVAVARNRVSHPDLAVEVPAVATELAPLRTTLTDWLDRLGVTADALTAVPLVVSELASNVAEHAYPAGTTGPVRVTAAVDGPGGLRVSVADDGRWVDDRRERAGYGLAVARELAERLDVHPSVPSAAQSTGTGTRVDARFALDRPTVGHRLGRAPLGAAVPGAFEVVEAAGGVPVVRVHGPVDLPVVDDLRSVLLQASGGGTRPLTVDLTGATGLAAAGVRLLYELSRYSEPLPRVIAPPGSVVHGVLTLAGLGSLLSGT
jgi:anti-sigma regulatory factor (Ser/Thr protein kinase)